MPPENTTLTEGVRKPVDLESEGYGDDKKLYVHRTQTHSGGKRVIMRLKIVPESESHLGRTHRLKSQTHFWEGTEAEFREAFDRAEDEHEDEYNKQEAEVYENAGAPVEEQETEEELTADELRAKANLDRVERAKASAARAREAKANLKTAAAKEELPAPAAPPAQTGAFDAPQTPPLV